MSSQQSGGIGVLGLLQVLFIGLKVTGNLAWSWPMVFIPLWISLGLMTVIIGAALTIFLLENK